MGSPKIEKQWPLRDIRYFECPAIIGAAEPYDHAGTLFHVTPSMDAWARRFASMCRERDVSIGHAHHLYIWLTPALRDGEIRPSEFQQEHWQRWVMCGLPKTFNRLNEQGRRARLQRVTIESVAAIAPESKSILEELTGILDRFGERLEITLKQKETRKYRIVVGHTIPTWPKPSEVWMTLTEGSTGRVARCKLIETQSDEDAMFLVGRICLVKGDIVVHPRSSFDGDYCARKYNLSRFVVPIEPLLHGRTQGRTHRAYRSRAR